ncbi:serine/threonine-protein kinase [Saccharothrix xinjiangensis]|uniref:non-specific serine/threonine protein kinase n=1 Tax=Saccharothrix xinjiangensis TaxID=204798 RepID=A0ABV9XST0_9PSEU
MEDLAPGTVLDGRFVVRRRLGAGGFGTVYLADQRVFDVTLRQVALKLFHRGLVTEANAREQLNDAVVLMRLQEEEDHPEASRHLITVLDAGFLREPEPRAFVAMEHAAGYRLAGGGTARTLRDLVDAFRPVPVELALRWITQVLRAVAWMHALDPPVLHCDLKADNVLPDGPDALKVADFGLAQLAFGAVGLWGGAGALTCQSPETLAGVEPTPASDVYSLGLLLHEVLAGRHPFHEVDLAATAAGDDEAGRRRRHVEARRTGPARLTEADNPDLVDHPLLGEVIAKCLRFRATERYGNAAVLLDEIGAYTSGGELTVSLPGVRVPEGATELRRLLAEAEAFRRRGRPAEARERAGAALARFPGEAAPHASLARLSLTPADWPAALRLCAAGLALPDLSPADAAELLDLSAEAYETGGQPSLAARMRERAAAARKGRRR